MSATQDFVALEWIRGELANTLQSAQVALEAVAESPDDASSMRSCLTAIHQVHGTLKMVQLEGPTQVAGEMEEVAQCLMNSTVPDLARAQETLMQAILHLPAYLDRLHREQQDAVSNYMPIVNNLRIARGEERIPGSEREEAAPAAGPDLSPLTSPPDESVVTVYEAGKGEENLPKIRARYTQTLAAILKKTDVRENLNTLGKLFTMLVKLCGESPMGNLSQIALALVEGIAGGGIRLDKESASLLRDVDGELKRLASDGKEGLSAAVSTDLASGMITLVNGSTKETARISAIKKQYAASAVEAEPEEIAVGLDDETVATVSKILIEELTAVTDRLDLYVRSPDRNTGELVSLLPNLEQIASTMVVLGNADHQTTVAEQIGVIREIEESGEPDDEKLLQMAQSLLQIESTLAALVSDTEEGGESDAFADLDEAQAAVVRESRTGLAACKDAVIDFISSGFDHEKIEDLPDSLSALRGGLLIVNQSRAGDVLEAAANYVSGALLAKKSKPALDQMDDLADAITSVDYFLERLLENASDPYLQMLEVAESAVEKLGYAVGTPSPAAAKDAARPAEAEESPEAPADEVVEDIAAETDETIVADIEESAEVEAEEATAVEPEVATDEDLIDDEILEIFIDEAEEVLENISEFLPQWKDRNDQEALTEVRRAFHTLKGSGRMVGATVVGELAWSIENMLNRVIDNTIPASEAVLSIVSQVVDSIPEGVQAFKDRQQHRFKPEALSAVADALAEGREPPALPEAVAAEPTGAAAEPEEAVELEEIALESEPEAEETAIEESVELEEIELESGAEIEDVEVEDAIELEEIELDAAPAVDLEEDGFDLADLEVEEDFDVSELDDVAEAEAEVQDAATAEELAESDDLELEEIFAIEAGEKLEIINQFISSPSEVASDLVAAFHTLKGSAAMAEINSISEVAAPLEQLANEYFMQSKVPDEIFMGLVRDGVALITTVLADIEGNRDAVEGGQELIARIESRGAGPDAETTFDFEKIILLSEENVAADGWQDVEGLIAELQNTNEQAEALNQPALAALVKAMLRVYSESPSKPGELVLAQLRHAHDHLVYMFDALASSQAVRPADRLVAELEAIDLSDVPAEKAPSAEKESPRRAEPEASVEAPSTEAPRAVVMDLPEDDIDEDILPIFLEESEELLEELDDSILGWIESGEVGEHLIALLRQLHTLKGGARMAGIASLGEYAHNFETFLIGIQQNPIDYDDSFFALLNAQQDELIRRVEIYQKIAVGGASDAELESLKTAAVPSLDAPEAPAAATEPAAQPATEAVVTEDTVVELPADEVDEDILPIFLEESDDLMEELEGSIQDWSESPDNMETLDVLLRNLHTLKGGARMAGLNSLGEYAHNFETFLIGIQQNPVEFDDDFFALLNKRQDEVIRRVEIYKKLSVGGASEDELASLTSAVEPGLEVAGAPAGVPADEAAPVAEGADETAEKGAPTAAQEMVRVSSDLLEGLVSLAGEASITRGRVEQQISDFGDSLVEMEETITRIREQVRRLEIEAESRETLIRSRHGGEGDESFDELEMDRYTMLQEISRALNEGSSDMMDLKDTLGNKSRDAETLLHQQARISGELQEGLTRTRMVPFARLIPRLRRIVRQISGEVGKSVRFDAYNVEGELDRNVLERIVAPLEHMLRNAVDHGIESAEDRVAAGKQEQGRISLRLSREGGYVLLTISDDGGGIDVNAVRAKAIDRGLIAEGQEVSDHEVMQFIMHAGFSTAQKLTQISGRGVGMDVVGSEIKALGGSLTIDSTLGVGTEFTIRIPFTVSINRALMVVVKEETYAVPLNTIEGIVRVSPYELEAYYQPDAPMFEYAGQPYSLAYMGKMLDKDDDPNVAGQVAPLPVILARSGDHAVALQVDRVIGSREVVVKTLGKQFGEVGGISGATVLGDGSVVIILDCMALVRSYEAGGDAGASAVVIEEKPEPVSHVRTVMIVDDSVTVRKVTSRLMERQGFEVETAKDGVEALEKLQEIRPDVVLLDIEMPRMDGFEVLRSVRRDDALKDLPIIMITSRTGEKHKQQAMELGVNQYLGKPFQEASLVATIEEVIAEARAKQRQRG